MAKQFNPYQQKRPKYNNKKIEVDGIKFDSQKEANYYGTLKMRKLAGEIKDFEMQKVYRVEIEGKLICKYIADFVVHYTGGFQVIDVKSDITRTNPVYRLKKKLIEAIYKFTIIEK